MLRELLDRGRVAAGLAGGRCERGAALRLGRVMSWNLLAPLPVKPSRTTLPWPCVLMSAAMSESFRSSPVASGTGLAAFGSYLKR